MATPYIQIIEQRFKMDCGVASLAMLLGLDYDTVLAAYRHNIVAKGATIRQMQAAARRLKRPIIWTRKIRLEEDEGLLCVRSPQWPHEHMVMLKEGLIFDTDGTVWETDVFFATYEAKPISMLKEGE